MIDVAAGAALFCLLLSALAVARRGRASLSATLYTLTILPCLAQAAAGLAILGGAAGGQMVLPIGLPWLGAHLRLDALSAFFLVIIGTGGAAISLFAVGYGRHEEEPGRVLPFYPAFLGAMTLVVLADDAFTFLVAWEVMSLLSWALVMAHHRRDEVRSAGYLYLLMAALGTMALIVAFGLLAGADGSFAFSEIRAASRPVGVTALAAGLVLIGAGSKAGIAPLHLWLPEAHPAAPSHVSALMSGVMTKVAVYAVLRVVFDLLGPLPWWASPALILLGAGTAVLGIFNAAMADDMKKILAYSTIENIGVIFAALGLAQAFLAEGMRAAAALALSAALFHAFNHMAFKSLLFMGAGAVLTATGRRDLDGLGGLIRRMPVTAFLTLVAVTAISALPPLNGFASEWMVFQSLLASPRLPHLGLEMVIPAAGGLLALAAALAAAAFVRFYGVAFLGRARSDAAARALEVDRAMLAGMGVLAALCVLVGLVPALVLDRLSPVVTALTGTHLPVQGDQPWLTLVPVAAARSTYNPLLVFAFIAVTASLAAWGAVRMGSRVVRRGPAWDCGYPEPSVTTQYGAGSLAQPLRRVLGPVLLQSREEVEMPAPGDMAPARHRVVQGDPIRDTLYLPVVRAVLWAATLIDRLQFLTIRRYLAMVMATLVSLLLVLSLWG
ncbi:MAG: hydrogenase 4 subunit B [Paracoccaceae bacterium]|nr:hydrogenase 4 subunit B [Paracoccaceae bacterium]